MAEDDNDVLGSIDALASKHPEARLEAALKLNRRLLESPAVSTSLPFHVVTKALIYALKDADIRVVRAAGLALQETTLGQEEAKPLLDVLESGNPLGRSIAADLLGSIGENARPFTSHLRDILRSRSLKTRKRAHKAIKDVNRSWRLMGQQEAYWQGHDDVVESLDLSKDDKLLVSGSYDGTVILWDLAAKRQIVRLVRGDGNSVYIVALSSHGRTVAIADNHNIAVLDIQSRRTLKMLEYRPEIVVFDSRKRIDTSLGGVHNARFISSIGRTTRQLRLPYLFDDLVCDPTSELIAVRAVEWRIVDKRTGNERWRLPVGVQSCLFSPDGETLGSVAQDGATVGIWDKRTGHKKGEASVHSIGSSASTPCAFSADGRAFAIGRGILDTQTFTMKWDHPMIHGARAVAFTSDGRAVISGGDDHAITLRDSSTGDVLATLGQTRLDVQNVALNGSIVASGSDGGVRVWGDLGREPAEILRESLKPSESISLSSNGAKVASAHLGDGCLIWSLKSRRFLGRLQPWKGSVRSAAWCPKGNSIAIGGSCVEGDRKMGVGVTCSMKGVIEERFEATGASSISSLAYSPDGSILAAVGGGTLLIWATRGGGLRRLDIPGIDSNIVSIAFSRNGKTLACGTGGYKVVFIDTTSWSINGWIKTRRHEVRCLSFSSDGRTIGIVTTFDNDVELRDVCSGALVGLLKGHRAPCKGVAFSSDSKVIATASSDGTVRLWDEIEHSLLRSLSLRS